MEEINKFGQREGHMADTPANRQALEDLVRDPNNFVGKSFRKTDWYAKTLPSGYQIWAQIRCGVIRNGGINRIPRPFKPEAGIDDQKNQKHVIASLTPLRAFNATAKFLDAYYEKNPSEDLAVYLEDMEFLRDNKTTDPSVWNYWMWLINMNTSGGILTALESFNFMVIRIEGYQDYMASKDIEALLKSIELPERGSIEDSVVWQQWMKCVSEALTEPEGSRSYLRSMR